LPPATLNRSVGPPRVSDMVLQALEEGARVELRGHRVHGHETEQFRAEFDWSESSDCK
jgi:hypothetical protein